MKMKLVLSTLLGMAAWSLSGVVAAAGWDNGPCPQPHTGPAPCIESEVDGNTYHFNGTGSHADSWYGHPLEDDFEFEGNNVEWNCPGIAFSCILNLSGQVKKCQDSNGDWRIGVRVTDSTITPGSFSCSFFTASGFPWYLKDPTITPHCPFDDDCDSFIPYDPSATTYTANFGTISISSLLGIHINNEHLDDVVFTPGSNANFNFSNSIFKDCNEDEGCSFDGILYLKNADSLDIY